MAWPLGNQFTASRAATEPGRGAGAPDDGIAGSNKLKTKSIGNVPTPRLERRLDHLHQAIHTAQGLHEFDDTKRSLVETGVHARMVTHELVRRGTPKGDCPHCWG